MTGNKQNQLYLNRGKKKKKKKLLCAIQYLGRWY